MIHRQRLCTYPLRREPSHCCPRIRCALPEQPGPTASTAPALPSDHPARISCAARDDIKICIQFFCSHYQYHRPHLRIDRARKSTNIPLIAFNFLRLQTDSRASSANPDLTTCPTPSLLPLSRSIRLLGVEGELSTFLDRNCVPLHLLTSNPPLRSKYSRSLPEKYVQWVVHANHPSGIPNMPQQLRNKTQ